MANKKQFLAEVDAQTRHFVEQAGGRSIFSVKQAAPLVGVSLRALNREIKSGDLIVSRALKGRVLVSAKRLAEWYLAGEKS